MKFIFCAFACFCLFLSSSGFSAKKDELSRQMKKTSSIKRFLTPLTPRRKRAGSASEICRRTRSGSMSQIQLKKSLNSASCSSLLPLQNFVESDNKSFSVKRKKSGLCRESTNDCVEGKAKKKGLRRKSAPENARMIITSPRYEVMFKQFEDLHLARKSQQLLEPCKFDVVRGGDVNVQDVHGNAPIHQAILNMDTLKVRKLLGNKKVELNRHNKELKTPLICAIETQEEVFSLMLLEIRSQDLVVNLPDDKGRTPLHYAVKYKLFQVIDKLLEHPDILVNIKDDEGDTPLHYAVSQVRKDYLPRSVLRLISHEKIDKTVQNNKGICPFDLISDFPITPKLEKSVAILSSNRSNIL